MGDNCMMFLCDNCGMPNFSTTFLESLCNFELSNSFDTLNLIDDSDSNSIVSTPDGSLGKPVCSSSPKQIKANHSQK